MPDYTTQATVHPFLPKTAFTDFEQALLIACGFAAEEVTEDPSLLYFYAEDGVRGMDAFEFFDSTEEDYSQDPRYADYFGDDPNNSVDADYIFQKVLNKPECAGTQFISIEGANTCSRMCPESFGGFASFITRTEVDFMATNNWISQKTQGLMP
jgi:hypothetical protein